MTDHPIPDALVLRGAKALAARINEKDPTTAHVDWATSVLAATPPLHGTGPNGEWGRWEQQDPRTLEDYQTYDGWYRFAPLSATEAETAP